MRVCCARTGTLSEPLEPRTLLATYYVAPLGADGAAGGAAAPWRTLQYAADRVAAGDTVFVRPGSYVGFDLRTSGTAAARITFKAEKGAVINQVNTVTNRDGINLENASYVTIDGFTLSGTGNPATSRAGIRVVGDGFDTGQFSRGVIVQNNACDRWGYWGILTGFADDIVIQNNVTSRSAREHGIYFSNSADRPVIRNNVSWGNTGCGIHMNADIETGNTALPNVDGIISGALVDGNTCYGNGLASAFGPGGGSGINCDGVRDSRFTNNLLYDNHAGGISLYQIDAAGPASGNVVANNTVIQAGDARWCLLVTDGAVNTTVFNNVLFNLHSFRGSISISPDSASGFVSDYNFLDPRFSTDDANSAVGLTQWRAATGEDAHSTALTNAQMQALYTNYAGKDFTLASGSAAIDKGVSGMTNGTMRLAPAIDLIRAARPSGAGWDVGAYERDTAPFAAVVSGKLTVSGTVGDDTITLSRSGTSIVVTRGGATMNFAASGVMSIEVYGDYGNDTITIGAGVLGTYVNAGPGNDLVQGGDDRDTLNGGAGKDTVRGGAGDDRLDGHTSPDRLFGEGGKDRLYGGDGDDLLDGGTHYDRLWGDAGANTLHGQGGDDYLYARNLALDRLFGGGGIDSAQVDAGSDVWAEIEHLLA